MHCFSWFVHPNSRTVSKWFSVNSNTCLELLVENNCILTEVSIRPISLSILVSLSRIIEEWTAQHMLLFKMSLLMTDVGANKNGQLNDAEIMSFKTVTENMCSV